MDYQRILDYFTAVEIWFEGPKTAIENMRAAFSVLEFDGETLRLQLKKNAKVFDTIGQTDGLPDEDSGEVAEIDYIDFANLDSDDEDTENVFEITRTVKI